MADLAPLVKLTKLGLACTKVEGNVASLAPLVKLTYFDLPDTVEGDHDQLKAIQEERAAGSSP